MFSLPLRTGARLLVRSAASGMSQQPPASAFANIRSGASPISLALQYSSSSSSSKPSSPSDRARTIAPATSSRRRGNFSARKIATRVGGGSGGGGGGGVHEPTGPSRLPSVPDTSHLIPTALAASSFFALHRPVSITTPIPKASTQSAFSSIFDPLLDPNKKASRLISVVQALPGGEGGVRDAALFPDLDKLFASIRHGSARDANGEYTEAFIQLPSQLLTPQSYRPFHPPPPPEPYSKKPAVLAHAQLARGSGPIRQMITIFLSRDLNGMTTVTARMSDVPSYINRIRMGRRERWRKEKMGNPEEVEEMMAISVKRQRKLKMKKHKYKKLMKKTRNLRRRLEKQ